MAYIRLFSSNLHTNYTCVLLQKTHGSFWSNFWTKYCLGKILVKTVQISLFSSYSSDVR